MPVFKLKVVLSPESHQDPTIDHVAYYENPIGTEMIFSSETAANNFRENLDRRNNWIVVRIDGPEGALS